MSNQIRKSYNNIIVQLGVPGETSEGLDQPVHFLLQASLFTYFGTFLLLAVVWLFVLGVGDSCNGKDTACVEVIVKGKNKCLGKLADSHEHMLAKAVLSDEVFTNAAADATLGVRQLGHRPLIKKARESHRFNAISVGNDCDLSSMRDIEDLAFRPATNTDERSNFFLHENLKKSIGCGQLVQQYPLR